MDIGEAQIPQTIFSNAEIVRLVCKLFLIILNSGGEYPTVNNSLGACATGYQGIICSDC